MAVISLVVRYTMEAPWPSQMQIMIMIACAYELDENDEQEKMKEENTFFPPIHVHHQVFPMMLANDKKQH